MQTRTLYALVAAALLIPFGSAVALSDAPSLRMKLDPAELRLPAGGAGHVTLYLYSEHDDANVKLAIGTSADAVSFEPASAEVQLVAGQTNRASFDVRTAAREGKFAYTIEATTSDGRATNVTGYVIVSPFAAQPPAKPQPAAHERPQGPERDAAREPMKERPVAPDHDRRILSILERIERLLARLEEREHSGRPMPTPTRPAPEPKPLPPVVTLTLADESVDVGEDGRRVALLVETREGAGRVPLHVRYATESGWRIALEKEVVFAHEHGRTWVWIELAPGETASVEYAVIAGDAVAKGVARFDGPRIA